MTHDAQSIDHNLRHDGRSLLLSFYAALRSLKLYPLENTTVQKALDDLLAAGAQLLGTEEEVEIRVSGDFLFVNDTRLRLELDNYASFSQVLGLLRTFEVGTFRIVQGVERREWQALLSVFLSLGTRDVVGSRFDELLTRCQRADIRHLQLEPLSAVDLRTRPERVRVLMVLVLAVVSVGLSVVGPKILGHATDIIFAGVIGTAAARRHHPGAGRRGRPGRGQRQLRRHARRDGRGARPWHRLHRARPGAAAGRSCSTSPRRSSAGPQGYLLNGVVQRTVLRLRADVEEKLNRLPLRYFDKQPRGELLSRVTNDIDNIAQTLQQTLSQLLTSLLTVVGVLVMMFCDLAAAGADRAGHGAAVGARHHSRSPSGRSRSSSRSGRTPATLNGQIEEAYTGHDAGQGVRPAARGRGDLRRAKNEELYEASFGAQFISGHHHAGDDVHREPQLRR